MNRIGSNGFRLERNGKELNTKMLEGERERVGGRGVVLIQMFLFF